LRLELLDGLDVLDERAPFRGGDQVLERLPGRMGGRGSGGRHDASRSVLRVSISVETSIVLTVSTGKSVERSGRRPHREWGRGTLVPTWRRFSITSRRKRCSCAGRPPVRATRAVASTSPA